MLEFLEPQVYTPFLEHLFSKLETLKLDVQGYELDHICYRVDTIKSFEILKSELSKDNTLLSESIINGRPIINFLLATALTYKTREIKVLEIPAPKLTNLYDEGYEHVEFVVKEGLEDFLEKYLEIDFETKGLSKQANREVRLVFGKTSVKFHESSLQEVIAQETRNRESSH